MLHINKQIQKLLICSMMVICSSTIVHGQTTPPTWWFGFSGAANFNFYDGTTQRLNNSLIVPAAFHKGHGIRPYGSILMEYRPAGIWAGMLNIGYNGSGAKFNDVVAPCNCPATLTTNTSYISVEPSLRLSVPSSGLYFFAGPSLDFNLTKDFTYTQLKQVDTKSEFSSMHSTLISGQVGAGYDIKISSPNSTTQVELSPFISYHPYFGRDPRTIESWSITSVRTGIALKFGKAHKAAVAAVPVPVAPVERDVVFTVREPKAVPLKRTVSETLPLLNAVFFDEGSVSIPTRYVILTKEQAVDFKEISLQKESNENMTGRSARQLSVYHNILNILGDRLRSNPQATISLNGASATGTTDGKASAESIKQYLVIVFGIDASRISTTTRTKPVHPSQQPGGTKELVLLHAEDTRVDISSASPELLIEVGGGMMKPVQIMSTQVDPLDSHVIFNVAGAKDALKSWSIDVTDSNGIVQHYGPYTSDMESIPGAAILGNSPTGDYKVTLLETTKNGSSLQKEGSIHLIKQDDNIQQGLRYSIVFDFDKAQTIDSYNKFLSDIVSPLISDGSTVIIHGHTDVVGNEDYNQNLSDNRAKQTQTIIEHTFAASGKNNVKFETLGYGEDSGRSPFENALPEERFYNRTVIIDILPANKL
ncbi:OmpA family protein [Mucilaginibacter sp.]|uniref:OmpA family protein n=1 Tax=Mucilaginibacter sp. TaxID=1882438 RepID=UPI00260A0407|nr:OmpA family protein [Mucilaginibacter sp.]MDB4920691.1 outer membrane protein OmpA [Mucilaginibacter sp.]